MSLRMAYLCRFLGVYPKNILRDRGCLYCSTTKPPVARRRARFITLEKKALRVGLGLLCGHRLTSADQQSASGPIGRGFPARVCAQCAPIPPPALSGGLFWGSSGKLPWMPAAAGRCSSLIRSRTGQHKRYPRTRPAVGLRQWPCKAAYHVGPDHYPDLLLYTSLLAGSIRRCPMRVFVPLECLGWGLTVVAAYPGVNTT